MKDGEKIETMHAKIPASEAVKIPEEELLELRLRDAVVKNAMYTLEMVKEAFMSRCHQTARDLGIEGRYQFNLKEGTMASLMRKEKEDGRPN